MAYQEHENSVVLVWLHIIRSSFSKEASNEQMFTYFSQRTKMKRFLKY